MPVGTPFDACPEGTVKTGHRLIVLNGVVIHQPSILFTSLPFIFNSSLVESKSAGTAGMAVVGQIRTL